MMSARTSFLVWWALPILCAGLGAGLTAFAGQGGLFGSGPRQIGPLILVVGYFAAVGLLALAFRARQDQVAGEDRGRYDKPVEAAMVALCAPVLALGLWLLGSAVAADFGRAGTISGKLASIDRMGTFGHSYGVALDRASPLILECRFIRDCGSPVPLLRLKPGAPVEVDVLNGRVLGLRAEGRSLVDPEAQRRWRLLFGGASLALLALYSAAFAVVSARLLFAPDDAEDEPWNAR